jgi:hypothetical protein
MAHQGTLSPNPATQNYFNPQYSSPCGQVPKNMSRSTLRHLIVYRVLWACNPVQTPRRPCAAYLLLECKPMYTSVVAGALVRRRRRLRTGWTLTLAQTIVTQSAFGEPRCSQLSKLPDHQPPERSIDIQMYAFLQRTGSSGLLPYEACF